MDLKFAGLYLSDADLLEVHRRSQAQDRRHVEPAQIFQLEVYFARFFFMLSSVAGIQGGPSQSNYAAGNTF